MNITDYKTAPIVRIVVTDFVLLSLMCVVPMVSHLLAFPFYKLNPMLFCMLAGILLVDDRRNAFALAILLPVFSMLVTGMPALPKAFCMVAELSALVAVWCLMEKRMPAVLAIISAIVAGKLAYYGLKALLFSPEGLVSTSLWIQVAVTVAYAALFAIAFRFKGLRK